MRGHRFLPLCAFLGVLFAGLLPNLDAQDALTVGKRDIIFLVDSTMGSQAISAVREFIKRFVDTMPIGPDEVQIGVAQFSNAVRLEMDLNSHGTRAAVVNALNGIRPRPGQAVNIGAALNFVRTNMLRSDKGSRLAQGVPQLLLLITSKRSSDSVEEPAKALQRMGVLTLAAGSKTANEEELKQIAFTENVVYMLKDIRVLKGAAPVTKIILNALSTLAGVVGTEGPTEPVVDITTVQTQGVIRDIVFLVDGSHSIGSTNFPYVRDFIINVVNQLDIRPDRVQIGLLQFADQPKIEFYLNSQNNRDDVVNKVSQLRLVGGSVLNTGAAMNYALNNMFKQSTGSRRRQGVQQVLVLITGGRAQDEVKTIADRLALGGVLIFTVSSGQADEALLKTVAFVPDLAYHELRWSAIPAMAEQIMPKLTTVVGDDTDVTTVVFPEETALTVRKRDIIFLVDSTMGSQVISAVREFIKRFVDTMPIGPDEVQIGVAQFSNTARLEMDLNSHGTREAVVNALNGIRPRPAQAVNIGAALNFVRTNMLRSDKGSRLAQGVPQLLLLITSKRSSDSVEEPAKALQRMGVLTLAAGSRTANEEELKQIAFTENVVYMLKDIRVLKGAAPVTKTILNALSTLAGVVGTEGPTEPVVDITTVQTQRVIRDIVFLVDGSNSIGSTNFPYVRDFIINVVNQLDIRPDRVQIGLLQFADQPKIEFYLNSQNNRDDVVNKVSQLRLVGGSVLNTGAAMNYALNNMFKQSTGSRRRQGVQQVLVLITGGRAQDEVKSIADRLALGGVLIFTVSSGQADEALLKTVAFVPDFAYHELRWPAIPAMAEQIMPKLTTVVGDDTDVTTAVFPEETAQDSADLALLIDGSQNVGAANFPYVRDLVLRIIESLNVGRDTVRVALALYNANPEIKFNLTSYESKSSVLETVKGLAYSGGDESNLGAALEQVVESLLGQNAGGRADEGVPRMLIVISAGPSTDGTGAGDRALKRAGVLTFGVAIGDTATADLEGVVTNKSFVLSAPDFRALARMNDQLLPYINGVVQRNIVVLHTECTEALTVGKRDFIFLVDSTMGSQVTGAVREFIRRFVDTMPIGPDEVQIGVAQFSNTARLVMDLNSHGTREAVVNALNGIRPRPAQAVNIGAALNFVRTNMLRSDKGSRLAQGVPQLLLLITSKKSSDSVEEPAKALQLMGVLTLAAGSKTANEEELKQIAFTENVVYMLKDIRVLIGAAPVTKIILNALSTPDCSQNFK